MNNHSIDSEINFLQLMYNVPFKNRHTWAFSLIPRISEISALCDVCGHGGLFPDWYPERPFSVIIGKGKIFPDILGCGAYPLTILSERVLATWSSLGLGSYTAFPLDVIVEPSSGRPTPPPYYHIKITGRCELDLQAMGVTITYTCPKCHYNEIEPVFGYPKIIKRETWDGSDVFASDIFPMAPLCTSRVVELAKKHKWTNFRFEPMDGILP